MAVTITRTQDVDDDGSYTTGTIRNNAWKQAIYAQIDALFTGAFSIVGPLTVTAFGTHSFSAGGTGANVLTVRNTTAGTGNYAALWIGNDVAASASQFYHTASTYTSGSPDVQDSLVIQATRAGGLSLSATHASGALRFYSAGATEVGRFDLTSSLQIGGTAVRATTAGTKRLDIFNGVAPVGTLTNGVSLYSTTGELYAMDAAGNATLQTPHDHSPDWVFLSENLVTGKRVRIEVEKLLQRLNERFGEQDWFQRESA